MVSTRGSSDHWNLNVNYFVSFIYASSLSTSYAFTFIAIYSGNRHLQFSVLVEDDQAKSERSLILFFRFQVFAFLHFRKIEQLPQIFSYKSSRHLVSSFKFLISIFRGKRNSYFQLTGLDDRYKCFNSKKISLLWNYIRSQILI